MRTLVTGGAGFIGSHLVDALLGRGDEVTVLDDFSTGNRENLTSALAGGLNLVEGSVLDHGLVTEVVKEADPHTIFHLAAQDNTQKSVDDPSSDAAVNVTGTVNVIDAGYRNGLDRFVFASTGDAIYGDGKRISLPAAEDATPEPLSPFGQGKLAAESYLLLYRRMYMFNAIALRFGAVYGPRQDQQGADDTVAGLARTLLDGQAPTFRGDGNRTLDYVYVKDVIDAMLTASRTDVEGAINLGSGTETSNLELLDAVGAAITELGQGEGNETPEPVFEPARFDEIKRISLDPARAAQELGWTATTPLNKGIRLTLESL